MVCGWRFEAIRDFGDEEWFEEIRSGASVSEFKNEIKEYTRTITEELLQAGKGLSDFLVEKPEEGALICPTCNKGYIRFNDKAAGCTEYKNGCKFVVWRTISEKKLSDNQIKTLIEKGKTPVIKGFKSKAGKSFDASLILSEGKVHFVFEPKTSQKA